MLKEQEQRDIFIMISLKQYLEEGRDAPLYHALQGLADLYVILYEDNTLKAKTLHRSGDYVTNRSSKERNVISLTRSLQFAERWAIRRSFFSKYVVILELDQRKLTQRHKFVPYNHFGDDQHVNGKGHTRVINDVTDSNFPINQYEENVIGDIKNLDKYLTKIMVNTKALEDLKFKSDTTSPYYGKILKHKLLYDLDKKKFVN
jgi:hypothetical protein